MEGRMHTQSSRERFAELTSSLGAGILGAGLGILFAPYLPGLSLPLLFLGGSMHAFGMWDMRRMERSGAQASRPLWALLPYWICWLVLIGIGIYILMGKA
jgi:hypothetical protein